MNILQKAMAWAGNDPQKWIALCITLNSWAAYLFLVQNAGFTYKWSKGFEAAETNRQIMSDWLHASATNSGNYKMYVEMFSATILAQTDENVLEANGQVERSLITLMDRNS